MEKDFVKPLLRWYEDAHRDLPWRHTRDPYRIWVSEIMLQQTRVEAVKAYYARFLEALPDVRHLAECPDDRLLKLWEGLGYYSRVRNMKKCANVLVADCGGEFPHHAEALEKLPGIGPYTAGAIASIAFGENTPAVDGNVMRVYARMTDLHANILETRAKREAEEDLTEVMRSYFENEDRPDARGLNEDPPDDEYPGTFTQAVIELGATVCGPDHVPECGACPVREFCLGQMRGTAEHLPVRIKKTERRIEKRTVLLIHDGEETAVRRRPEKGLLAGMYEFPNAAGTLSESEALEYVKGLGYEPLYIRRMPDARHLFSHIEWQMTGYEIRIADRGAEKEASSDDSVIFADRKTLAKEKAIPSAFRVYADEMALRVGIHARQ